MTLGAQEVYVDRLVVHHAPEKRLAISILLDAVKSIKACPKTLRFDGWANQYGAKARLLKALEVLEDVNVPSDRLVFWCEIAEIDVDWISDKIKTLAKSKPLLLKAWEVQNNVRQE